MKWEYETFSILRSLLFTIDHAFKHQNAQPDGPWLSSGCDPKATTGIFDVARSPPYLKDA
jgi:hypothetical protein